MKILFVCTGNSCRSPMAEVIFRNLCIANGKKDVDVNSAGVFAANGMPMSSEACKALENCGEKTDKIIITTKYESEMAGEYDLIIAMTLQIAQIIKNKNVKTLDEYTGCGDIFDPFSHPQEIYNKTCEKLQTALGILYSKLF